MTHDDVIAALAFFGLNIPALADLVGESEMRCRSWLSGAEAAPRWLDHLFYCWAENPEALALAREDASLRDCAPAAICA